jgi:hypothetical protein
MKIKIKVTPDGTVRCLHTDAIDLRRLGRLEVTRASNVEFDNRTQHWTVSLPDGTVLCDDFIRRDDALAWERDYFEQRL